MKAKIFALMAPCGAPSILIPAEDNNAPPGYPYLAGISVWCWHCRDFVDGPLALAHQAVAPVADGPHATATPDTPRDEETDRG